MSNGARRAPVGKPGHPKKLPNGTVVSVTPRVATAIRYMVHGTDDGIPVTRQAAAKAAGISDDHLRKAFRNPAVVKAYNSELDVLRTSERARNLHTAVEIRDDGALKGTAAGGKTRIEAARYIDGEKAGGIAVNVNVGVQNIQPGYVVTLPQDYADGARQMLKLSGSHANVLDLQADVPTDEPGTR